MAYTLTPVQFKCDVDILTTADSGPRRAEMIKFGCFHTTENSDDTPPDNVAKWQLDRANQSSYNVLFGTNGRTVRGNDDNYKPWAAGPTANTYGVHGSAIGRASRTREQWLKYPKQLEAMAQWAADVSKRYGLPLVWLTPEQLRAGARGFCSHDTVSKAWREVNHTDPGPGFPHDLVLERARVILAGGETVADNRSAADLTLDQLAGYPWHKWQGWPQLAGLTLVDAVATIGAALNIDGFKDMRK